MELDQIEAGQTPTGSPMYWSPDRPRTPEGLITVAEAAKLLNARKSNLYDFVRRNEIPHYRIRKSIRFLRSELLAWARRLVTMNGE